jgi:micrococcal nuclease
MSVRWIVFSGAICVAAAVASEALADPCKAIPDRGPPPAWVKAGAVFTGEVLHVIDGDGFCVGSNSNPDTWVEVRMVDFDAPELRSSEGSAAKAAMSRIAAGRTVRCVVKPGRRGSLVTYDRVLASCTLSNGRSIAQSMVAAGVRQGGN